MTSKFGVPRVKKWPFVIAVLLMTGLAIGVFYMSEDPPSRSDWMIILACFALGIVFGVLPFLAEFREESQRFEASTFRSTLDQVRELGQLGQCITKATAQWSELQSDFENIVQVSKEISEKTRSEMHRLGEITEKADAQERDHLRLELDKRRRSEREWLEVLVGIMDHIFALHHAALRSGQSKLIQQIAGFQNACQEIGRRVGLSAYIVDSGERFDDKIHKIPDGTEVPENAVIAETIVPGFRYQGHPVRHPIVSLQKEEQSNDEK